MILFIDDEPRRVASFIEYIQEENHVIQSINNLNDANQSLENDFNKVNLIILDIMMPIQDFYNDSEDDTTDINGGFLFYKKIRKKYPCIPIIIFTNITDENIHEEINYDPFSVFMHKRRTLPFELSNKINEILKLS